MARGLWAKLRDGGGGQEVGTVSRSFCLAALRIKGQRKPDDKKTPAGERAVVADDKKDLKSEASGWKW